MIESHIEIMWTNQRNKSKEHYSLSVKGYNVSAFAFIRYRSQSYLRRNSISKEMRQKGTAKATHHKFRTSKQKELEWMKKYEKTPSHIWRKETNQSEKIKKIKKNGTANQRNVKWSREKNTESKAEKTTPPPSLNRSHHARSTVGEGAK
jgi:hypothetical protein